MSGPIALPRGKVPIPDVADDKSIDVRFTPAEDVVIDMKGAALRPRHLFMAAAILTRLANRMIDAGEQQAMLQQAEAAAVAAALQREGGRPS